MKRLALSLISVFIAVPIAFVLHQAVSTLHVLTEVERERDTWQRPDDVLRHLNVEAGDTVVDLGSGAGYFALKLAPLVGPTGQVLAIDLRRQSLAFLWIRAKQNGFSQLRVIRGDADDPRLPAVVVDAVLIANTYHELSAPTVILERLATSLRRGARLVVVDRGLHETGHGAGGSGSHGIDPSEVGPVILAHGFELMTRDDRFIDRPSDDPWWLLVFEKR